MAYDGLGRLIGNPNDLRNPLGYEAVACPVEAVTSYFILIIVCIGQAVHIRLFRHGLVERCIEYTYHGGARHQLLTRVDSDQVRRVVQRCKVVAFFHCFFHFLCNDCGGCKFFSPMYHTVSNRSDLVQALNNAGVGICQGVDHKLDGLGMGRHCLVGLYLFAACRLIGQASVNPDPLAESLCQDFLGIGIDQLEF